MKLTDLLAVGVVAAAVWMFSRKKKEHTNEDIIEDPIIPLDFSIEWKENFSARNPAGGNVFYHAGNLIIYNNTDKDISTSITVSYPDKVLTQMGSRVDCMLDDKNTAIIIRIDARSDNPQGLVANVDIPANGSVTVPISFQATRTMRTMFTNIYGEYFVDFYLNYEIGGVSYSELVETTIPAVEA